MKLPTTITLFIIALMCAPIAWAEQSATSTDDQSGEQVEPANEPTELDLPQDAAIKIKVSPIIPSNVVDRVCEPASIIVDCPGALSAEVFLVPVDSPYGGRALQPPRSLGKDSKPADGMVIPWSEKVSDQYVKLFAVVRKRAQPDKRVRSHTIDIAVSGARLKPKPAAGTPTKPVPPTNNGAP